MLKNNKFNFPIWGFKEVYAALILLAVTVILQPAIALFQEIPLDSDSVLFFYPLRALHADESVGLWNPYLFCGFPRDANPQSQLLYLPNVIFQIVSAETGYAFLLIFHLWIGAFLFYTLLRGGGLSFQIALFGAVTFLAGTFWQCKITNLGILEGIAWIPGILLCLLSAHEQHSWRYIGFGSIFLSLLILAGVPHTFVYCQILLICISVSYAVVYKEWLRIAANYLRLNLLSLMMTAGMWLPALDYSFETQRVQIPLQDALVGSLPWSEIWKTFIGGLSQPGIQRSDPWEGTCYIGVSALLFVPIGWKRLPKHLLIAFVFAFMFAVFCTTGKQGFLFPFLYHYLPGWSFLNLPNRSLLICSIVLPIFASVGLHTFLKQKAVTKKQKYFLSLTSIALIIAALVWCGINPWAAVSLRYSALTSTFQTGALSDTTWAVYNFCFWAGLTGFCLTLYVYQYVREWVLVLCLLILVVFQSIHYSQRLFLQTAAVDTLLSSQHTDLFKKDRVAAYSPLVDINSDVRSTFIYPYQMYRLPEVNAIHEIQGYDPMYPKRYGELVRAWSGTPQNSDPTRIIRLNEISKPMLDFFQVKHLIGDPGQKLVYSGNAVLSEPGVIGSNLPEPANLKQIGFRWLLTNAFHIPQKTKIGNIRIHNGTQTIQEFPIIAGEDIANYISEKEGQYARHRSAQVYRWFPIPSLEGYTEIQQYMAIYKIDSDAVVDAISIELTVPKIQLITLQINAVHENELGLPTIVDHDYAPIFQNPNVNFPAYITNNISTHPTWQDYIEECKVSPGYVNHSVYISDAEGSGFSPQQNPLQAEILSYERTHSDTITIEFESNDEAFLVIPENYSTYWQAFINGSSTKVVRVNHAFMAVQVPDGRYQITLQYTPTLFYYGCSIGLAGLLITLYLIFKPFCIRN